MRNLKRTVVAGIGATALLGLPWVLPTGDLARPSLAADKPAASSTSGGSGAAPANEPDRGWVGVMLEAGADGKPVVASVYPAGPAAFAGVRQGDVIAKVNGQAIDSSESTALAVESLIPGGDAKVTIVRHGREQELTVHVGSLREFHGRYAAEMLRRDPRDPRFGEMHGVSDADMSVELARRTFEQNRRLEVALRDVQNELQALRREVRALKK